MNKDQAKGTLKEAAGKAQTKVGSAVGSKEEQAKGLAKQAEGKAQKGLGDIKGMLKDAKKK